MTTARARLLARWRAAAWVVVQLGELLELEARGFVVVPSWAVDRLEELGALDRDHTAGETRITVVNGVRIVASADQCGGQWRIDGTAIAVADIRALRDKGLTPHEIMRKLPRLTLTEIYAALAFVPVPG